MLRLIQGLGAWMGFMRSQTAIAKSEPICLVLEFPNHRLA